MAKRNQRSRQTPGALHAVARAASHTAAAPGLDTEIANRRVDPFETNFQGVIRTNDPLLLERGGEQAFELYRDLIRDGKVFSGMQKRKLAVISKPWQVEPVQDGETGRAHADVVTKILKGFNFDRLCGDLMNALLVGFTPAEVVWTIREGLVVPARVVKRAQKRFVYVDVEESQPPQLRLRTRENMLTGIELPDRKFIVHRVNEEDDNPYGMGLGLQLFWPVFFKRKGVVSWNKLNDRFGSPTPWGKYPRTAGNKEKGTLFDALRALTADGAVMTPEGMSIELLESKLTGSITTQQNLCEYMDDWIMEVLLGQSPRGKSGGAVAAASNEREDVRLELSQADSDLVSETLNTTLIRWICELNRLEPCLVYRVIKKDEDLKAASETDKNVSEMGFRPTLEGVKARYGEHWEEAPKAPALPTSPGAVPGTGAKPETEPGAQQIVKDKASNDPGTGAAANFAEGSPWATRIARVLGDGGDAVLKDWMDRIRAMVDDADSPDQLRDRLLTAFGDLPTPELVEMMALAFAAAELAGMDAVAGEASLATEGR